MLSKSCTLTKSTPHLLYTYPGSYCLYWATLSGRFTSSHIPVNLKQSYGRYFRSYSWWKTLLTYCQTTQSR
jgi:hypothetical protein